MERQPFIYSFIQETYFEQPPDARKIPRCVVERRQEHSPALGTSRLKALKCHDFHPHSLVIPVAALAPAISESNNIL